MRMRRWEMGSTWTAVALTLLLLSALRASPCQAEAFALIIGNNESPPDDASLRPLQFADDDALRYAALFERTTSQLHLLTVLDAETQQLHPQAAASSQAPDAAHFDRAVEALAKAIATARQRGEPTTVFVVFSGHGSNDESGTPYLALRDERLTTARLFAALDRMNADRAHLIVDACNAGAVVGSRGRFDSAEDAASQPLTRAEHAAVLEHGELKARPHVGVVVATAPGQEAHEWTRIRSGVFSHEFLSGALGAADINGDLIIEYSEMAAFMAAANRDLKDPRARPHIRAHAPLADLHAPLLSLRNLKGPFLSLRGVDLGRFSLSRENGQNYLEAHVSPKGETRLLLPANEPLYLSSEKGEARLPGKASGVMELSGLSLSAPGAVASRGRLDQDFGQHLFRSAFDREYYLGFVDSRGLPAVRFEENSSLRGKNLDLRDDTPLRWERPTAIALFAAAGVGLGVGVWQGIAALGTHSDFEATPYPSEAQALADDYKRQTLITGVALSVAVLAAVGGTYLWVTAPEQGEGAMLHMRGNF